MNNQVQNVNNIKAGICPHGLPAAACPICSASGGGTRLSDRNRKIGEMTYHECAMIGNMMKAAAARKKNHENALRQHFINAQSFEIQIQKAIQSLKDFTQALSKTPVFKPAAFVLTITFLPLLNIALNVSKIISTLNNLKFEITDKLNAVYGEIKAFINKKLEQISETVKKISGWFFKIFKKNNADDDDTKIDEDKKLFNLKKALRKLKEKFKNRKESKK